MDVSDQSADTQSAEQMATATETAFTVSQSADQSATATAPDMNIGKRHNTSRTGKREFVQGRLGMYKRTRRVIIEEHLIISTRTNQTTDRWREHVIKNFLDRWEN